MANKPERYMVYLPPETAAEFKSFKERLEAELQMPLSNSQVIAWLMNQLKGKK